MPLADFSRSAQTVALIEALRTAPIGKVVNYDSLSDIIGENIVRCRHYLRSAIKALYDEGVPFGTVRGLGVKRLTSEEIPDIGDHAVVRIRRGSRLARKRMSVINAMNDVANETRVRVNTAASLLGILEHFSQNKSRQKIEAEVQKGTSPIPPGK